MRWWRVLPVGCVDLRVVRIRRMIKKEEERVWPWEVP